MPLSAVTGALLQCTFGLAPSSLNVLPISRVTIEGRPAATVAETIPMVNIPPFAMCQSLANPQVAAATAAALGVLTPMPCIPSPVGQWTPMAPRTTIGGKMALASGSMLPCAFGGQISITFQGAVRTQAS